MSFAAGYLVETSNEVIRGTIYDTYWAGPLQKIAPRALRISKFKFVLPGVPALPSIPLYDYRLQCSHGCGCASKMTSLGKLDNPATPHPFQVFQPNHLIIIINLLSLPRLSLSWDGFVLSKSYCPCPDHGSFILRLTFCDTCDLVLPMAVREQLQQHAEKGLNQSHQG